jgi:hypothetical protein
MLIWCANIYWFTIALPGCAWRETKRLVGNWIDSLMR